MSNINPDEDLRRGYSIRIYYDPKDFEEFKAAVDYVNSLRLEVPEVKIEEPAQPGAKRALQPPRQNFKSSDNGDRKKKQINLFHVLAKKLGYRNAFNLWNERKGDDPRSLLNLDSAELSYMLDQIQAELTELGIPY